MSGALGKWIGIVGLALAPAQAQPIDYLLRDAAARIDFGWFSRDERLIAAAVESFSGEGGDPWRNYLRAYAAYRLAHLGLDRDRPVGQLIDDCREQARLAQETAVLRVEALVLEAGCAGLAVAAEPLRAPLHRRRLRQSLAQASAIDRDNPRLLLVALQYFDADELGRPQAPEALLAAFARARQRDEFPDWGEAEALTLGASRRLAEGDLGGARDLVQEALLIAPGHEPARALERRIRELSANP